MSDKVRIEVGTSAEELGRRFVEAWHAAERGEARAPERVLIFHDLETLLKALTTPRLTMLKHLSKCSEPSIRSLAGHLNRDYRRVHDDVRALIGFGLIRQDGKRLTIGAEAVEARMELCDHAG